MLPNKISESVLIGLRPDRSTAKARVTLRLERGAVVQGEGENAKTLWFTFAISVPPHLRHFVILFAYV
jgi:hypothetical protein